jgi:excisionase family DNA binding protein
MTMPQPWVSIELVAQHLEVSKDTIYHWVEGEKIPAHRVGRFWKFKIDEIDQWVRDGGAAAAGDATVDR